jgi:adenylate cyclase
VKAGLGINWAVQEVLRPKVRAKWNDLSDLSIASGVGIATGEAMIVRGGVRNDSDLISIGEAPNVAAKLSELRGWPDTYITEAVYSMLSDDAKYSDAKDMWSQYGAQVIGGKTYPVKGSSYWWRPD